MNRRKLKKLLIVSHRQMVYEKVLDDVIAGKQSPEYLHERFIKLKEVQR